MALKFLQVYAVVDADYRVLWVGGEWDEFALSNASNLATADLVLSTSILDHIADSETRAWTARLIDIVMDTKRPLRLEYRCDSPGMARKFLLTIQPMKEGRALMVHDLRDAWHFSPPLQPWHADATAPDHKCSYCGAVQFDRQGAWVSCDDVGEAHPSDVAYTVCGGCRDYIETSISEVLENHAERIRRD